ncbi:hypothetical protein ACJX0J_026390, partial [Zea mays]
MYVFGFLSNVCYGLIGHKCFFSIIIELGVAIFFQYILGVLVYRTLLFFWGVGWGLWACLGLYAITIKNHTHTYYIFQQAWMELGAFYPNFVCCNNLINMDLLLSYLVLCLVVSHVVPLLYMFIFRIQGTAGTLTIPKWNTKLPAILSGVWTKTITRLQDCIICTTATTLDHHTGLHSFTGRRILITTYIITGTSISLATCFLKFAMIYMYMNYKEDGAHRARLRYNILSIVCTHLVYIDHVLIVINFVYCFHLTCACDLPFTQCDGENTIEISIFYVLFKFGPNGINFMTLKLQ